MIIINNYIWIFGENQGLTADNNSYYLWKYAVNIKDDIEKYFVLDKTESNKKIYNTLSKYEKKFILVLTLYEIENIIYKKCEKTFIFYHNIY